MAPTLGFQSWRHRDGLLSKVDLSWMEFDAFRSAATRHHLTTRLSITGRVLRVELRRRQKKQAQNSTFIRANFYRIKHHQMNKGKYWNTRHRKVRAVWCIQCHIPQNTFLFIPCSPQSVSEIRGMALWILKVSSRAALALRKRLCWGQKVLWPSRNLSQPNKTVFCSFHAPRVKNLNTSWKIESTLENLKLSPWETIRVFSASRNGLQGWRMLRHFLNLSQDSQLSHAPSWGLPGMLDCRLCSLRRHIPEKISQPFTRFSTFSSSALGGGGSSESTSA